MGQLLAPWLLATLQPAMYWSATVLLFYASAAAVGLVYDGALRAWELADLEGGSGGVAGVGAHQKQE